MSWKGEADLVFRNMGVSIFASMYEDCPQTRKKAIEGLLELVKSDR